MSKFIEVKGKTVEEAIRKGIDELKISREDAKIEIIEDAEKGMFGILSSKPAKVRISISKKINEENFNTNKANAEAIVKNIFEKMQLNSDIETTVVDDIINVKINNEDAGNIMIGYKGETLEALQLLTNTILMNNSDENVPRVVIDICGYRERKQKTLIELANKMANNVKKFKKTIKLEPMSAYDRRIVHSALQDNSDIITESEGQEPRRRIVIKLK